MEASRRGFLRGLFSPALLAAAAAQNAPAKPEPAPKIYLNDYQPKSMLVVAEHRITRAKKPGAWQQSRGARQMFAQAREHYRRKLGKARYDHATMGIGVLYGMGMAETTEKNALTEVAKKIGKAAAKVAVVTGVAEPVAEAAPVAKPATPKSSNHSKLPKKNKSRLPRRQKKALQNARG